MSIRTLLVTVLAAAGAMTMSACDPAENLGATGMESSPAGNTRTSTSFTGTIVSVYDGDTITVRDNGRKVKVRLLGIDAPEMKTKTDTEPQCGAVAARDALRQMLPTGSQVTVSVDTVADTVDRYGRTLGYVSTPTTPDAARALVSAGLVEAWVPSSEPTPTRENDYRKQMQTARTSKTGSWATCDSMGR